MQTPLRFTDNLPSKEDYFTLFTSTGWNTEYQFTPDKLYAAISNSWYIVSAYAADTLVGFGRIISDGVHHALIVDLIILPPYQRQGIGSEILRQLIAKCREHQIRDVQLFCAKGKADFYRQFNFQERPGDAPGMQLINDYVRT